MGKRIIQQRRGRGSSTYRVRRKAFRYKINYPSGEGKAKVVKLISSPCHTAPLAKILLNKKIFYNLAFGGMFEGQEIVVGGNKVESGNILSLKDIPVGSSIYNIETKPGDGGRLIRTSGNSAVLTKKSGGKVAVLLPSKKEVFFDGKCRATLGVVAGQGRLEKPIIKAGRKYKMMRMKGKLWPRTSAVKMNVIDHPFGSGRGKTLSHGKKGKIPKLHAPPGAKVGSLRPKRTGRRKK
jgi:large subunit ribosomal protein L2